MNKIRTLQQLRSERLRNKRKIEFLQKTFMLRQKHFAEALSPFNIGCSLAKGFLSIVTKITLLKQGYDFIASLLSDDENNGE